MDDIMELLWQNGEVVMQSQRYLKKSPPSDHSHRSIHTLHSSSPPPPPPQPTDHSHANHQQNSNLFMQEDEMATWLLPDLYSDLLFSSSSAPTTVPAAALPVRPPAQIPASKRLDNFSLFSRFNKSRPEEAGPSASNKASSAAVAVINESTVVDSSDTPMVARVSENALCDVGSGGNIVATSTSGGGREVMTCDLTVTSSQGASSASTEPTPQMTMGESREIAPTQTAAKSARERERKRKGRDGDDGNHSEVSR